MINYLISAVDEVLINYSTWYQQLMDEVSINYPISAVDEVLIHYSLSAVDEILINYLLSAVQ